MSNTDTDFIILDENPVYANQISVFIQSVYLNLSCLRFQRPQLYLLYNFEINCTYAIIMSFCFKILISKNPNNKVIRDMEFRASLSKSVK
jgi:hypothetical protein